MKRSTKRPAYQAPVFRYSWIPVAAPAGSHREDDGGRADDDVPSGEHPFLLVFPVSWSARMFPHLFVSSPGVVDGTSGLAPFPMETMTVSTVSLNSSP